MADCTNSSFNASKSFKSLILSPCKSFSQSPGKLQVPANSRLRVRNVAFLKVSPRVVPRAVLHPAPAIRSLLVGAPLSHSNFMSGSARTPHKYDHFHEKTFIYNFIPSFQARQFACRPFELPPEQDLCRAALDVPLPSTHRARKHRKILLRSSPRYISADRVRPRPLPTLPNDPPKCLPQKRRLILCLKDGQNLSKPGPLPFFIDLQSLIDRFIGPLTNSTRRELFDKAKISLKSQAYYSLLETVTDALGPKKDFVRVFYLDGREVEDLANVDEDCQVMLFSSTGSFQGVKGL